MPKPKYVTKCPFCTCDKSVRMERGIIAVYKKRAEPQLVTLVEYRCSLSEVFGEEENKDCAVLQLYKAKDGIVTR